MTYKEKTKELQTKYAVQIARISEQSKCDLGVAYEMLRANAGVMATIKYRGIGQVDVDALIRDFGELDKLLMSGIR